MFPVRAFIGFICLGVVCSQNESRLKVSPKNAYAQGGHNYDITCNCNEVDMQFYFNNKIVFMHQAEDGAETVLTTNGFMTLTGHAANNYAVQMQENSVDGWTVTITIKDVNDSDAGQYICLLQSGDGKDIERKISKFTVLHPIDNLVLKVGEEEITETTMKSVEFVEGDYDVKCVSGGSNPQPILEIYIGGTKQDMGRAINMLDEKLNHHGYKATISRSLYLAEEHDKSHIKCMASVPHSGFDNIEAGFNLGITSLTPSIQCDNTSALVGDRRALLRCYITAKKQIDCQNTMWENGNEPDIVYYPGITASDRNEAKCEIINSTTIQSDLILNYVSDKTFDTTFFLDFVYLKGKHRHPVYLIQKPGAASSTKPMALLIVLLTVIASYINRK